MKDKLIEAMRATDRARGELYQAMELLKEADAAAPEPATPAHPAPWLDVARGELGVKEVRGDEHNPHILEYLASTSIGKWGASRDETPWCSAFVNWCMQGGSGPRILPILQGFHEGTGSAMARSWLGWGIELEEPRPGCVVVLKRGKPPQGHVGLYVGEDPHSSAHISVLGGNQSDSVCIKQYPKNDVLSYRWPDTGKVELFRQTHQSPGG